MWNVATIGGATAATVATALVFRHQRFGADPYRDRTLDPIERIEMCQTIRHLVVVLQDISKDVSTENLAFLLSESLEANGVTEGCLKRLSSMHRSYGTDLGIGGYAINFVWANVLEGIVSERVVIIS